MDDPGLQQTPTPTPPAPPPPPPTPPVSPIIPAAPEPIVPPPPPAIQPETPKVSAPKKKFPLKPMAGALVALLLVGGALILSRQLVEQRQTAEQQAAIPGACWEHDNRQDCIDSCTPDGESNCQWNATKSECKVGGKECGHNANPPGSCTKPLLAEISCSSAWATHCDKQATCDAFCVDKRQGCGCNAVRAAKGCPLFACGVACTATSVHCTDARGADYCMPAGTTCNANTQCTAQCLSGNVNCYFCEGETVFKPCSKPSSGISYSCTDGHAKITGVGNRCGMVQCDGAGGSYSELFPCESPQPSPRVSPSPSPSPSPNLSCVDLTSNNAAPKMGDVVNFTCQANFSSVTAPKAYFRYSTDNGVTFTSPRPPAGAAVNATTKKASHNFTINKTGKWEIQCRICAQVSGGAVSLCTKWGRAGLETGPVD